jgi:HEPN domain-containing protein
METPLEIKDIAQLRLEEATILKNAGYYDGAYYLAGYALELSFKAKICECLNIEDFYLAHAPKSDLSKIFMVHNLSRLLLLSGLYTQFEIEKTSNIELVNAWSYAMKWSEKARYDKRNTQSEAKLIGFLESINIITSWINSH